MQINMGEKFRCAMCGGAFVGTRAEEDCMAEARQHFGKTITKQDCAVVCNDCFKKIDPKNHPHEVERAVAELAREKGR